MLLLLSACNTGQKEVTLLLGGDVMLARGGQPIFEKNPWQSLQQLGLLDQEDLFFVNLESPLAEETNTADQMNLCSDANQVKLLVQAGVDLVSLANNHQDDCHPDDAKFTETNMKESGILAVGSTLNPVYLTTTQGRFAVIAVETVTDSLEVSTLLQSVRDARQKADVVIVSLHWGSEYQAGPCEAQEELAHRLADSGADVIWGHHPHILQRMEWIETSDERSVLVIYSLGNLLADQWMLEDAQRTALVRLSFSEGQITRVEIIPLKMERSDETLHPVLEAEERDQIADRLQLDNLEGQGVAISLLK